MLQIFYQTAYIYTLYHFPPVCLSFFIYYYKACFCSLIIHDGLCGIGITDFFLYVFDLYHRLLHRNQLLFISFNASFDIPPRLKINKRCCLDISWLTLQSKFFYHSLVINHSIRHDVHQESINSIHFHAILWLSVFSMTTFIDR